jgi:hypothetical protein
MTMPANSPATFGTDRVLLYNVEPWNLLGFAVPNFGDNIGTTNHAIHRLADEIGKVQLYIMRHIDVWRTQPPSINTVMRLGKLLNRINQVLAARQMGEAEQRLEGVHYTSTLIPWNIHPVPYFSSSFVRNGWLKEYNELVMILLTNMYQHSDNNLPLTITTAFATQVYQYAREIKIRMGTELLALPRATVESDTFLFSDEHYASYRPSELIINTEALDTPGPIESMPTEDDLRLLVTGIPATDLLGDLKQYPVAPSGAGYSGQAVRPGAEAGGTADGRQVAAAGGTIGQPTI